MKICEGGLGVASHVQSTALLQYYMCVIEGKFKFHEFVTNVKKSDSTPDSILPNFYNLILTLICDG